MLRTEAILIAAIGFALPASAQNREVQLAENTIDCRQFKKTGPQEWIEVGVAVFDLGRIKDIHLTDQPVTPGFFKFGGVDVYPVLEQKCGAAASFNVAQTESASDNAVTDYKPPQATINALVPMPENEIVKSQSESTSCGDRKSVYVADGLTEAEGVRDLIEVVFNKNIDDAERSGLASDFIISGYKNNKIEWVYRGKQVRDRFTFTPVQVKRERTFLQSIFAPVRVRRQIPVILAIDYIKPNRNGTGDAILYVSGLRTLFASKESHRFKFEGKRPSEALPEAFYFDRCELNPMESALNDATGASSRRLRR
jgi:hypothetical protein